MTTVRCATSSRSTLYAARRDRFGAERNALTARWNRVANLRLVAFVAAAAGVVWAVWTGGWLPIVPAAVALGAFVVLVVVHRRLGRERRRAGALFDLNDEAEQRVRRDWAKLPVRHAFRAEPDHPFANDLDLFGRASVYHLLETVTTTMGSARLRDWLLAPAPPAAIGERQAAVAELAPALDWRQEFALRGRLAGEERRDPEPFLRWAEGKPVLAGRRWLVWAARTSVALLVATVALDVAGITGPPFWIGFLLLNLFLSQIAGRGANEPIVEAASQHDALVSYARLLAHVEGLAGEAPLLCRLRDRLVADGTPAHRQVRRLHRLTAWAVPRSSILYLPLQLVACWDILVLDALERWQTASGRHVRGWLDVLGEVEALAALAGLAHDEPGWAFPAIDPSATAFAATALGHPLLADDVRVVNDVEVGPPGTFLLVTGSNMSGKSTLLRAIGVNVVLAGAGAPVCASSLRLPPVALWTSVRVQDSLERGVSFFMAELLRLKQIVDAARATPADEGRVLYLLDEILQGTNTAERQIAARRIVRALVDLGAIGAVSTHDLTLAEGPELSGVARLAHFRDTVAETPAGPVMGFDYRLRPGLATSTNALRLMDLVGFDLGTPVVPGAVAPGATDEVRRGEASDQDVGDAAGSVPRRRQPDSSGSSGRNETR
jgi:MutS domain V